MSKERQNHNFILDKLKDRGILTAHPDSDVQAGLAKVLESFLNAGGFPNNFCRTVNEEIAKRRIPNLLTVSGRFKSDACLDFLAGRFTEDGHWWSIDREKRIIDLTVSQFNTDLLPWNRFPKGICVILPGSRAHQRFMVGDFHFLD